MTGFLVLLLASLAACSVPQVMRDLLRSQKPVADVVRSLPPLKIACSEDAQRKQIQSLTFKIPKVESGEKLQQVQLQIFASIHDRRRSFFGLERLLQVTIRWPEEEGGSAAEASPTTLMQIFLKRNTWLSVNLSQSVRSWRQEGGGQLDVHLHLLNPYTNKNQGGELEFNLNAEQQPFLLLLSAVEAEASAAQETAHAVSKRSVPMLDLREMDDYEEETNNIWDGDEEARAAAALPPIPQPKPSSSAKKSAGKNPCRRKSMYIDFSQIHYDSWVLAPAGYEAYQCVGRCAYPMSEHLAPTKHAVVQTLLHSISPKKAQKACCVPTKLKPISLLYLDEDGVLTYRFSYQDMVVAECGCR